MTETEWIMNQYLYENNQNKGRVNLEDAKNFVFIWALFESRATGLLYIKNFENWAKNLEIEERYLHTKIVNKELGNEIYEELVDNINSSFNHFYQKYKSNSQEFINHLYNQNKQNVNEEKLEFIRFTNDIDSKNKIDKVIFLFFIAKRMRNKFFHGIKSIGEVSREHKEFKAINKFLISISSLLERR